MQSATILKTKDPMVAEAVGVLGRVEQTVGRELQGIEEVDVRNTLIDKWGYTPAQVEEAFKIHFAPLGISKQNKMQRASSLEMNPKMWLELETAKVASTSTHLLPIPDAVEAESKLNVPVSVEQVEEEESDSYEEDSETMLKMAVLMSLDQAWDLRQTKQIVAASPGTITETGSEAHKPDAPVGIEQLEGEEEVEEKSDSKEEDDEANMKLAILMSLREEEEGQDREDFDPKSIERDAISDSSEALDISGCGFCSRS